MSYLSVKVSQLKVKIEKLISLHHKLRTENEILKSEKDSLEIKSQELKKNNSELEKRIRIIKLAKSLSETDEKSEKVKLRINELVREIDKCIALLNS